MPGLPVVITTALNYIVYCLGLHSGVQEVHVHSIDGKGQGHGHQGHLIISNGTFALASFEIMLFS